MPRKARPGSKKSSRSEPAERGAGVDAILGSFDGSTADLFQQLREHAEHLQQWELKLREQEAKNAANQRPNGSPPWLEDRRSRLSGVRSVVRERLRDLRKKERILEERERACEQIVEQRRAIAAKESTVNRREQRVVRAAARTRASVSVLAAVIVGGVAAGGGWAISGVIQPRDVVARGVLATLDGTDPKGAWANRATVHLNSERVAQTTARELGKRGITELSSPEAVGSLIKNRVGLVNRQQGSLMVELQGTGATNTRRTLESLLAETVSAINNDDSVGVQRSKVDGGVEVDFADISTDRVLLSAAIALGIALLAGLIWLVVHFQARRSSQVIERLAGPDDEFARHAA